MLTAESNCFQPIAAHCRIGPDKTIWLTAFGAQQLSERTNAVYHVPNEAKKVELHALPKVIHSESTGITSNQE
jgi:hypothetical protein